MCRVMFINPTDYLISLRVLHKYSIQDSHASRDVSRYKVTVSESSQISYSLHNKNSGTDWQNPQGPETKVPSSHRPSLAYYLILIIC